MKRLLVAGLALGAMSCGQVNSDSGDPAVLPDAAAGEPGPQGLYIGRPSPVLGAHVSVGNHHGPRLSADGQRLYFAAAEGAIERPFVATRQPDGSFGKPLRLAGANLDSFFIAQLTMSADEKELIAQASPVGQALAFDLYRATRADRDGAFDQLRRIDELSADSANDIHPFLRGSELFFASDRGGKQRLYVAKRAGDGVTFGAPQVVTFDGVEEIDVATPFLSGDGKTLYFERRGSASTLTIFRAVRTAPEAASFTGSAELAALTVAGAVTTAPFLDEVNGEILFESSRAWSPAPIAIWRARLCKGAPCEEPVIACASGLRSVDQRHCYAPGAAGATWPEARAACVSAGGHLVTINSEAERALVETLGLRTWIGASDAGSECTLASCPKPFVWENDEPFLFGRVDQRDVWIDANQPDDYKAGTTDVVGEDCLELSRSVLTDKAKLNDLPCATIRPYVCEIEIR